MANEQLRVTLATAANKPAINKTRESCSKGKYSSSSPFSYSLNLIFPFMNAINSNVYAGWCSAHLGELALAEGHKSAEAGADGARESKIKWISNWFKENLTLRLSSCVFAPPNGRSIGAIVAPTRHVERLINHLNVLKLIKKEHTLWQLPNLNAHPHHIMPAKSIKSFVSFEPRWQRQKPQGRVEAVELWAETSSSERVQFSRSQLVAVESFVIN